MEPDQKIIDLASERRRRGPRFDGGLMQILEVSRDLICLCRSGSITAINSAGARMLGGKTTEEMIGRSMAEFLIPEYGPVLDLFLSGMSSEDRAVPTRIMRQDGLTRDVELQVHRAREIAKDATVVTCRDLSDAETPAVPARLDSRFHLFVENAMNLVCHTFNGTIRYINKAGVALLGAAEPEAVLGLRLEDIFPDDFARLLQPAMIDSIVAEDASVPLRLRRLDGTDVEAVIKIARLPSKAGCELMVEARDVSGHNRALAALRRTNEALEARIDQRTRELAEHGRIADTGRRFTESLIATIPNPVWFKDCRGEVRISNPAFDALFTHPAPGHAAILPEEDSITDSELLAGSIAQARFEATVLLPGGGKVEGLFLKTATLDGEGRPDGIVGIMTDIGERRVMEREMRRLTTTDPLTGALNRRSILSRAATELERSRRYGRDLALIVLDVDHFRQVNDTHGHAVGDHALRLLVAACMEGLRGIDAIGRMGGEEFVVMLPETPVAGAMEAAERLRQRIAAARLPLPDGGEVSLTASLGLAICRPDEREIEVPLARAEQALIRAKAAGRDRIEVD